MQWTAAVAAKSLQLCPTLCNPTDGSPPGSTIPGILQARTLEWVAISFSNAWKWKVKVKSLSCIQCFATPWTAAYQAPSSMGFFQARVPEWAAIAFSYVMDHYSLKEWNVAVGNNIDGLGGHQAKQNKSEKDKYCMISYFLVQIFVLSQSNWLMDHFRNYFYFQRPSNVSTAMLTHLGEPGEQPVERLGLHIESIHFILLCLPELCLASHKDTL